MHVNIDYKGSSDKYDDHSVHPYIVSVLNECF